MQVTIPQTARVVQLRTVTPARLLRYGECPELLLSVMLRGLYGNNSDGPPSALEQLQNAMTYATMVDTLVMASLPDDGDTTLDDLSLGEKRWLYEHLLTPTAALFRFVLDRSKMWLLWMKCKTFSQLPSAVFGEDDPIAAYQLDNCVLHFGTVVENMLLERDEMGSGAHKTTVPRYNLSELLDPEFVYPRQAAAGGADEMRLAGIEGLKFDIVQ